MIHNVKFAWCFQIQNCGVKNVRYSKSRFNMLNVLAACLHFSRWFFTLKLKYLRISNMTNSFWSWLLYVCQRNTRWNINKNSSRKQGLRSDISKHRVSSVLREINKTIENPIRYIYSSGLMSRMKTKMPDCQLSTLGWKKTSSQSEHFHPFLINICKTWHLNILCSTRGDSF